MAYCNYEDWYDNGPGSQKHNRGVAAEKRRFHEDRLARRSKILGLFQAAAEEIRLHDPNSSLIAKLMEAANTPPMLL